MRNLEAICKELKHDRIDVLKMDIEGSEYDIIPSLLESEIQIKQILIEFHHRFFNDGFERTKSILALFKQNNYKVFAISDSFQEISFIRDE